MREKEARGEGGDQSLLDLADSNTPMYTFDAITGRLIPPPEMAEVPPQKPIKTSIQKFAARAKARR